MYEAARLEADGFSRVEGEFFRSSQILHLLEPVGAFLGSESWRQDEGTGRGGCLGERVLGGSQAKQNPADIRVSSSMSHSSSENLRTAAPSLPLSWLGKKRFPGETAWFPTCLLASGVGRGVLYFSTSTLAATSVNLSCVAGLVWGHPVRRLTML